MNNLETAIGYTFKDKSLLKVAITHSSYANQYGACEYNERLEFLGDSILELCVSEYLVVRFKNKKEGELTKIRAKIVCENSLYLIATKWNIGQNIYISKGEELTGGRSKHSILADAVEAIIAAVYLDSSYENVRKFILKNFKDIFNEICTNDFVVDYKTKLQEFIQKNGENMIRYEVNKFIGPPHQRVFFVDLYIMEEKKGRGSGYSKKEAEQMAAKQALFQYNELDSGDVI